MQTAAPSHDVSDLNSAVTLLCDLQPQCLPAGVRFLTRTIVRLEDYLDRYLCPVQSPTTEAQALAIMQGLVSELVLAGQALDELAAHLKGEHNSFRAQQAKKAAIRARQVAQQWQV